jgi:hypothetical protein
MYSHANGECCPDDKHGGDGIAPWSNVDLSRFSVTMGLFPGEHAEDCEVRKLGERPADYECDCEHDTFSSSRCEGCGSWLGGDRWAFGLWRERQTFRPMPLP